MHSKPCSIYLLQGPVSLDRRTESEAVVVEELAERVQAVGGAQVGDAEACLARPCCWLPIDEGLF